MPALKHPILCVSSSKRQQTQQFCVNGMTFVDIKYLCPDNIQMQSRMWILLLTLGGLATLASGCSMLFPDRSAPKSAQYSVNHLKSPWDKIAAGEDPESIDALKADIAYENSQTGAIISLNSLCRKYSEMSLKQLTVNLVRGIGGLELVSEQSRTINAFTALDSVYLGTVDGVKLQIRTVVIVADQCTYDFVHVIVPSHDSAESRTQFEDFLNSFRAQ
jgi:hypothetical protein